MVKNIAVYTRIKHETNCYAWKFERVQDITNARLDRSVNEGFGLETLFVPVTVGLPDLLDSIHTQEDFKRTQSVLYF